MSLESSIDCYQGRTILITGGRGYIGSALAQAFADIKCKLILLDQMPVETWKPENRMAEVVIFNGNVSERETWDVVLPDVDYVFHLAAREYFYRSEYDPQLDYESNSAPILHLLEVCRQNNYQPKIVFASSANLFGSVNSLPVNEDHQDDPLTMWAIHKLTSERYFRHYAQKFNIPSITLRLANVYGPTARRDIMTRVVINNMINRALEGKELKTFSNRGCVRDFIFLDDVAQAFLLAGLHCGATENPMYILGSGEGKTIENVWCLIAETVGLNISKNVPIKLDESVEIEPLELRNFVADTTRFQDATGWKPQIGLAQGIDITVRSMSSKSRRYL